MSDLQWDTGDRYTTCNYGIYIWSMEANTGGPWGWSVLLVVILLMHLNTPLGLCVKLGGVFLIWVLGSTLNTCALLCVCVCLHSTPACVLVWLYVCVWVSLNYLSCVFLKQGKNLSNYKEITEGLREVERPWLNRHKMTSENNSMMNIPSCIYDLCNHRAMILMLEKENEELRKNLSLASSKQNERRDQMVTRKFEELLATQGERCVIVL